MCVESRACIGKKGGALVSRCTIQNRFSLLSFLCLLPGTPGFIMATQSQLGVAPIFLGVIDPEDSKKANELWLAKCPKVKTYLSCPALAEGHGPTGRLFKQLP
jgi:hypothetical protein